MAIETILEKLTPKLHIFHALAAEGCRAEFFIGWFLNKSNTGDVLPASLLARLAEFNLGLSLDIYAPDEDDEPHADLPPREQPPIQERESF